MPIRIAPSQPEQDYYQILELPRKCDSEAIKTAYRRLALICHPDKNKNDANATAVFQKLGEAYETLKDSARRKAYDKTLPPDPRPKGNNPLWEILREGGSDGFWNQPPPRPPRASGSGFGDVKGEMPPKPRRAAKENIPKKERGRRVWKESRLKKAKEYEAFMREVTWLGDDEAMEQVGLGKDPKES